MNIEAYMKAARASAMLPLGSKNEFSDDLLKHVEPLYKVAWHVLENCHNAMSEETMYPTLGILGLLNAMAKSNEYPNHFEPYLIMITSFLEKSETEAIQGNAFAVGLLSDIGEIVVDTFIKRGHELMGLSIMTYLVQKVQVHKRQLTSMHVWFLQLCLTGKCLSSADPYLIEDIEEFSPDIKGFHCRSLLLYLYYAGVISAARKRFKQALYFFEACIRVPAVSLSHIMLEAYKKFILISLMKKSTVPIKPTSQVVQRILKPSALPYTELATAFESGQKQQVDAIIAKHEALFMQDGNTGLIAQVVNSLTRSGIKRLTRTFLTLSLSDVAARVGLPDAATAEKYIRDMIMDGDICAKINQVDNNVIFLDRQSSSNSTFGKEFFDLQKKIIRCVELNSRLSEMNEKLITNPEYVAKVAITNNEDEGISTATSSSLGNSTLSKSAKPDSLKNS